MSIDTLKAAGSSLENIQLALNTTSHNISNVNTFAYKAKYTTFEDVISESDSANGLSGTAIASIGTDFTQGSVRFTGVATHLALNGQGFFTFQGEGGQVLFGRAGTFSLDANADLVDPAGNYVLSTTGSKVTIPADASAFGIQANGEVVIQRADQEQVESIGQLQLATFINQEGLKSLGQNLYTETVASGSPQFSAALDLTGITADTSIVAGAVESSNVDLSTQFVDLISLQRSYQAVSKAVTTQSDVLEVTLGLA